MSNSIKVMINFNGRFWLALFERQIGKALAVARHIFGDEPSNQEVYEFITLNYQELKFSGHADKNKKE